MSQSFSIVTWNVNSLRARLPRVMSWLDRHQPDVLCMQETKCQDESFPAEEFKDRGYQVCFAGESRGLNGVAIAAKHQLKDVHTQLPGREDDTQQRFISARIAGVQVINLYVPNGQALGSDAFFYKLDWLSRLQAHLVETQSSQDELVLLGDFNIAPDDRDVWNPEAYQGQLHCSPHERRALGYLEAWGLKDALRALHPEGGLYTWFDYRNTVRGLNEDEGLRIDLIYLSQPLLPRLTSVEIDLEERAGERPSDHAPVTARLSV